VDVNRKRIKNKTTGLFSQGVLKNRGRRGLEGRKKGSKPKIIRSNGSIRTAGMTELFGGPGPRAGTTSYR